MTRRKGPMGTRGAGPQVLAFIYAEFPSTEQGKAMGLFGMVFPLGGIVGPLLGGLLVQADVLGWQWRTVFFVNVPIGLVAALAAVLLMPAHDPAARPDRPSVDLTSVLMLAAGLLALLYPLVQGRELGWPLWTFALLAAAPLLLAAFVRAQRALTRLGREPLVAPRLLANRVVAVGSIVMVVFYCGMGAFFVLTLYVQNALGYSPTKTALTLVPATFGIVAGNALGTPLVPRLGRRLPMAGLALLLLSSAVAIAVVGHEGGDLTPWHLLAPVVLFGAGLGLGAASLMLITIRGAEPRDAGAASGVVNTVVQLGLSAGPATIGTVYFARLAADGPVHAVTTSLTLGLAVFAAALLACRLLPKPPRRSRHPDPA